MGAERHQALGLGADRDAGSFLVVLRCRGPPLVERDDAIAEAARRGLMLTVFHNRRWDGDFLTVRRLVEAGELGEVVRFESRFERFRPEVAAGRWRESPDTADGGGLLLDLGAHLIDQARVLFGHPRLLEELPSDAPVLLAWHRQQLMQEAVGRWLKSRIKQ